MVPREKGITELSSDRAIIAGADFDSWTYRTGFDFIVPLLGYVHDKTVQQRDDRPFWLVASVLNLSESQQTTLIDVVTKSDKNILLLDKCPQSVAKRAAIGVRCAYGTTNIYEYKSVYAQSQFCLVARSERLFQLNLIEALTSSCIPVIYADNVVLPFTEVIYKISTESGKKLTEILNHN